MSRAELVPAQGLQHPTPVHRFDRRERWLGASLAALAGAVDAVGFLALGGFFVSFMSGNTTRAGVGLVANGAAAAEAFGLIVAFVLGVTVGTVAGRARPAMRSPLVLALVSLLLAAAALLTGVGAPRAAGFAMALAMGAENTVFHRDKEGSPAVTYMTGTLVKLGQRAADALLGGDRTGWVPHLLLWLSFVGGACVGAVLHRRLGAGGLWVAAAVAALLAVVTARRRAPVVTR